MHIMVYNLPKDDCQSYLMNGMFDHPPTESNGYIAPHFGNFADALVLELQTTCDFFDWQLLHIRTPWLG